MSYVRLRGLGEYIVAGTMSLAFTRDVRKVSSRGAGSSLSKCVRVSTVERGGYPSVNKKTKFSVG